MSRSPGHRSFLRLDSFVVGSLVLAVGPCSVSGTIFAVGSHKFDIAEDWGLQPGGVRGTGSRVWPASVELARFLADNEELVRAKKVVEWGAGVGALPSLVAARAGAASVLASDGEPSAIPLLAHNVARNSVRGVCEVRRLRWGCAAAEEAMLLNADVILGSDIVWGGGGGSRSSQLALLESLEKAAALNPDLLVLVSFCPRYKSEELFWKKAKSKFVIDGQWRTHSALPDCKRWSEFTTSNFVQEGGGIWICRLRPQTGQVQESKCMHEDCQISAAKGKEEQARRDDNGCRGLGEKGVEWEELLSDDSLLEAGGSTLSLDDLINPLDARDL